MIIQKIKQFIQVWKDCFGSMKNVRLFTPFAILGVIQFIFLLMILYFYQYPINNLLVPVIKLIAGENFLHYPDIFFVMPLFFSYLNIFISGIIGIIIIGCSTYQFAQYYQKRNPATQKSINNVLPKYMILFVLWLVETVLVLGVIMGLPQLFEKILVLSYTEMRYVQLIAFFIGLFIASIFAYTSAAAVLNNRGIIDSFRESIEVFGRHIITTFLLVSIPNLANMPFNYASGKTIFILQKFNPEMVFILISLTILISIVTNYLLVGTLTRYYLIQKVS